MMSGIINKERRSQQQQRKTLRRQTAAAYIDENHDYRSKSENGVSAGVFIYIV
jgi:hypothetical protein